MASSLDGYIAGPNVEFDGTPVDPEIALHAGFGGLVMGRRSDEVFQAAGGSPGWDRLLASRPIGLFHPRSSRSCMRQKTASRSRWQYPELRLDARRQVVRRHDPAVAHELLRIVRGLPRMIERSHPYRLISR